MAAGLPPVIQSMLPHLPQSTEVLIGDSRVVSTRYIARPASGIVVESGSQQRPSPGPLLLDCPSESDYQQNDSGYCQGGCDCDGEGRGAR
ncbi:MAG: hypothetical protein Ct9H300mP30_3280 [Methanobacteriota archaeon]|nr:MAG: hypothetical protein Ct9H300mP30_3280 [Euryarchaeota archaeon]